MSSPLSLAVLAVGAWLLVGCAAPQQAAQAGDPNEQVCTREVPVGTTIAQTRCRTRAQMEQERAAAQELGGSVNRVMPAKGADRP